ncbi:MAG: hypothetical protein KC940_23655 [Candidatus Omnitrophica bacterium]|nr:hypothetical protein [Candidatus Omnitrophota bacterium]
MGANGKQAVGILHPPGSILDRVSERILKSNSRTTEVIRDLLRTVGVLNRRSDLQVAFVWENHYFFDLNDCIPEDRGWEKIRLVADINDQG